MRYHNAIFGAILWSFWSQSCYSFVDAVSDKAKSDFAPVAFTTGKDIQWPSSLPSSLVLTPKHPVATIDYGSEVAGYPFFEIEEVDAPVEIEVKYSEPYNGLHHPWADGPYTFSTSLSNALRVETFKITQNGRVSSLIQGGQRWQSIKLIAGKRISISKLGFVSTVDMTEPEDFRGQFSCDAPLFNEIWKLGAKAASRACLEKGSQGAVWEIDPVKGAFVQSTRASPNAETGTFGNYKLEFETLIDRAGVWWTVAQPLTYGSGLQLLLTSNLPEGSTFANVNRTLTPPNSILLAKGYGFVNQTTLDAYLLDTFTIPFDIEEKKWLKITTTLLSDDRISVHINGKPVFNISLSDYYTGGSVSLTGAIGFGAYQDQSAWVRNAKIYDSANGTLLYKDNLRDEKALVRYGTQANVATVCLDGPKRDRLIWLGDFYHTSRIIGASNSRFDWSRGTLSFLLDTQSSNGEIAYEASMGYDPTATVDVFSEGGSYPALEDYQMLGFLGFYHLIKQTNDLEYASETWPKWEKQMKWLLSTRNSTDGLIDLTNAFLGASSGGSAVNCLAVETLNSAAEIAEALNHKTADTYRTAARKLTESINTHLWNEELGVYSESRTERSTFGVSTLGWCITSGVANSTQASRMVSSKTLGKLKLGPGYKADTTVSASDASASLSPNTNGFLLPALFMGNASSTAKELLYSMWGAMLPENVQTGYGNDTTATGASWEYLNVDGAPGLDLFTSLSHPWGGAATYVLTEWAAGLKQATGAKGFGYKNWVLEPETGVEMGLKNVSARVVTGSGDALTISWGLGKSGLRVSVDAPPNTMGIVRFRGSSRTFFGDGKKSILLSL